MAMHELQLNNIHDGGGGPGALTVDGLESYPKQERRELTTLLQP